MGMGRQQRLLDVSGQVGGVEGTANKISPSLSLSLSLSRPFSLRHQVQLHVQQAKARTSVL